MWPSCRTLLTLSLTLNVFLLGGIAGALYRWLGDAPAISAQRSVSINSAAADITTAYDPAMAEIPSAPYQHAMPRAQSPHGDKSRGVQLLATPDFDLSAIEATQARTRNADFEQRHSLEECIVSFAPVLPSEERASLALSLHRRGLFQASVSAPNAQPSH